MGCIMSPISEQHLVDQQNVMHRNSWMTEVEIEELERNSVEDHGDSSQQVRGVDKPVMRIMRLEKR